MQRLRLTPILLGLLAFAAVAVEPAGAASPAQRGRGEIVLAAGGITLNQAISMVERRYKARVVRSDVRQDGDRKIYVLRLLDDAGNAQVVRVDAQSGQIL